MDQITASRFQWALFLGTYLETQFLFLLGDRMNPSDDGPYPLCPACGYPENGFDDPNPLHYLDCPACAVDEDGG